MLTSRRDDGLVSVNLVLFISFHSDSPVCAETGPSVIIMVRFDSICTHRARRLVAVFLIVLAGLAWFVVDRLIHTRISNPDRNRQLIAAVFARDPEKVSYLLEHGADSNARLYHNDPKLIF